MIWMLIDAIANPDQYAVTFRRDGKTPTFTICPVDWLTDTKIRP